MSRPTWRTYIRDIVIFAVGVGIVVQQTGFPYLLDSPDQLSIPALLTGALFCNGPVVLQALALRFGAGTSTSGQQPAPSPSASPPEPSSETSSGGS